jgi:ring-1,2-phenylacetyl-CoA epoxidase subunit PaaC
MDNAAMQAQSIQVSSDPSVRYLLRVGDTCLILAQRLSEWCGHAPVLEEDIAMANIALDLIGQSRAVLSRAGEIEGRGHDEDQLAFLRDERDYRNPTIVELPNADAASGVRRDFAFTVLRGFVVSTFLKHLWTKLELSADEPLAAIAGKALKEARYHQQHTGDWVVRLGDGTDESARRMAKAMLRLWRFVPELFESDDVEEHAARAALGPRWCDLRAPWQADVKLVFQEARVVPPAESAFRSTGKRGVHTESMGYLLAEMQFLQRTYPGGAW